MLLAAKAAGEDARVVTVLNAGKGIPISLDDPYMKNLTAMKEIIGGGATRNSLACEVSLVSSSCLTVVPSEFLVLN